MKKSKKCPKCQSRDIYFVEYVVDIGHSNIPFKMNLGFKRNLFGMKSGGELEAWFCGDCGYTEFYVKEPSEVKDSKNVKHVSQL